jgi:hypothetical protein
MALLSAELTSLEDAREDKRDGKRSQKLLTEAEAQIRITELGGAFWSQVLLWAEQQSSISPSDLQILGLAASIPRRIPNARQSKRLLEIEAIYSKDAGEGEGAAS